MGVDRGSSVPKANNNVILINQKVNFHQSYLIIVGNRLCLDPFIYIHLEKLESTIFFLNCGCNNIYLSHRIIDSFPRISK